MSDRDILLYILLDGVKKYLLYIQHLPAYRKMEDEEVH